MVPHYWNTRNFPLDAAMSMLFLHEDKGGHENIVFVSDITGT